MSEEKTRDEILQERIAILENVSLMLGFVHGGISKILEGSDEEMRGKLTDLHDKLSKQIGSVFYNDPNQ